MEHNMNYGAEDLVETAPLSFVPISRLAAAALLRAAEARREATGREDGDHAMLWAAE